LEDIFSLFGGDSGKGDAKARGILEGVERAGRGGEGRREVGRGILEEEEDEGSLEVDEEVEEEGSLEEEEEGGISLEDGMVGGVGWSVHIFPVSHFSQQILL